MRIVIKVIGLIIKKSKLNISGWYLNFRYLILNTTDSIAPMANVIRENKYERTELYTMYALTSYPNLNGLLVSKM